MTKVEHYRALVDGLFALRSIGKPLSQQLEGEIAEVHHILWSGMSLAEQTALEGEHGIIEEAKRRWMEP